MGAKKAPVIRRERVDTDEAVEQMLANNDAKKNAARGRRLFSVRAVPWERTTTRGDRPPMFTVEGGE